MEGKKRDWEERIGELLIALVVNLIYNHYLIIDVYEKIPLQLVDEEGEWVDINTDKEDKITIGYDYIP